MDLNKLKAFLCVAKHGNFTRASEELFISQPALSKKISDFEAELGVSLLLRDNRSVKLTQAGLVLYNQAPPLLQVWTDLEERVKQAASCEGRHLSFICSGIEGDSFIPMITAFRDAHPEFFLELRAASSPESRQMIRNGQADFGFQLEFEPDCFPSQGVRRLFTDHLNLVVSQNHPFSLRESVSLQEVKQERYIAIKPLDRHLPFDHIQRFFQEHQVDFEGGIDVVDSLGTLILRVAAGLGVSTLSSRARERYGSLIHFCSIEGDSMEVQVNLIWNENEMTPAKRAFLDFLDRWLLENQP